MVDVMSVMGLSLFTRKRDHPAIKQPILSHLLRLPPNLLALLTLFFNITLNTYIMSENYIVNYDINLRADSAIQSVLKFQEAIQQMNQIGSHVTAFQKKMESAIGAMGKMAKKVPTIDVSTGQANNKLDALVKKLEKIQRMARQPYTITVNEAPVKATRASRTPSAQNAMDAMHQALAPYKEMARPPKAMQEINKVRSVIPKNIGYRTLGPTMLDSGGIGALDFVKGMGIAYGISGVGNMMGNALRDAIQYDNLMQTTKNILGAHDNLPDFAGRFKEMENMVRQVGVETKYTAPEVADASKFLAMAGFNLDAINRSIRAIADIALVGDTALGETADVFTNIMTAYGIGPNRIKNAADVMTMTFTKSNTTLMEMAEAYKYSASLLAAGGVSFEEATAGLGILGDTGIKGSQAGTTLRTIMANIVNPTKKQAEQWKAIGVQRMDAYGNMRALTDIFEDLRNRNLNLTEYYNLFHKTAAQGAVSLAANVDKWNEVLRLNLMSDGMVSQLADEKKNTIAGLWAQLTSAFTENGMQAFEALQAPIKGFLNETIGWLKTKEAADAIRSVSQAMFELMGMLKDFSMTLLGFWNKYQGFIKAWLEWQVRLVAIITPLRIVKSLLNFGGYITNTIKQVGALATQFGTLAQNIHKASAWKKMFNSSLDWPSHPVNAAEVYNSKTQPNIGSIMRGYGIGAAGIVGTILGSYYGASLGEQGSAQSMLSSLGGAAIGGSLSSLFVAKAIPWLFAGPAGWATLAVAGIASLGYAYHKINATIEESARATNDFLASTQAINGINYSEHATMADQYLSIVYNKQLDANKALAEYVKLRREELGLMAEVKGEAEKGEPFSKTHKELYDTWIKPFETWGYLLGRDKGAATAPVRDKDGNAIEDFPAFSVVKRANIHGRMMELYKFNGAELGEYGSAYSQLQAAKLMYGMGMDTKEGSDLAKIVENYNKMFKASKTLEEAMNVRKDLLNYVESIKAIPGSEQWSMETLGQRSMEEIKQSYHYVTAQRKMLLELFNIDNPKTANAKMTASLVEILNQMVGGRPVAEEYLKDYLLKSGIGVFDESRYGAFGSDAFMATQGWDQGRWNGRFIQDGDRERWVDPETLQKNWKLHQQQLTDLVRSLMPNVQAEFAPLVNNQAWNLGQELAKGVGQGMGQGGANGTGTPNPADYSSHYRNRNAVPKQVIVKIDKLMNVESIDMTKAENQEVMADLRSQMAQMLIDVVHDFDESYHG
jgi:TP901 family phage tail tape measure protein